MTLKRRFPVPAAAGQDAAIPVHTSVSGQADRAGPAMASRRPRLSPCLSRRLLSGSRAGRRLDGEVLAGLAPVRDSRGLTARLWSGGLREGLDAGWLSRGGVAPGEVGGVVSASVAGPGPGPGGPVVSDREVGDLVYEVSAGGNTA